jgi:ubiquitin C-terminal hydrolase
MVVLARIQRYPLHLGGRHSAEVKEYFARDKSRGEIVTVNFGYKNFSFLQGLFCHNGKYGGGAM